MSKWTKKRRIMRRYDLTAHIYDMQYGEEQTAKIEAALKDVGLDEDDLVLDVGCGTGLLFDHVAQETKETVGLDISRKILFQAKKRSERLSNIHLMLADADNLPLKNDVFSIVFAVTLLQNMPNPVKTLDEIKRVTKGNAVMVVTGLKKKFLLQNFRELLLKLGLIVIEMKNENLKCYVAICSKLLH